MYQISDRDFQKVKQRLLLQLTNLGQPLIEIVDANHRNRGELLLRHHFDGIELKHDYARHTLKNLQSLWDVRWPCRPWWTRSRASSHSTARTSRRRTPRTGWPDVDAIDLGTGGGRGGAGRTLLTANLGIQLARPVARRAGRSRPSGSSLHSALGFARVRRGLAELAAGGADARLADVVVDTSINHLRLVCGLTAGAPPADPMAFVQRVGEGLADLGAEFVLLDCGSGRSPATLAAFGWRPLESW